MRTFWFGLVGLGLAACGGSGGAAPLRAVAVAPAGVDIDPSTAVSVTFDRDPDTATLRPAAFVVRDARGPLSGEYTYDAARREWRCTLPAGLPRGALVTASVDASVRSLDGAALAARSWSFAVRDAVPRAPVVVRTSVVASFGVHVAASAGRGLLLVGSEAWPLLDGVPGPVEPVITSASHQLRADSLGQYACAGSLLGPGTALPTYARRTAGGAWGLLLGLPMPVGATLVGDQLLGNSRGDLLALRTFAQGPATWRQRSVAWLRAGSAVGWSSMPDWVQQADERCAVGLGEDGEVVLLRDDGEFVLCERRGGTAADRIDTLAQGPFLQVEMVQVAADGTVRAVWHAPGAAWQAVARRGEPFAAPTMVPVAVSTGTQWRLAADGTAFGWLGDRAVRSTAGAMAWQQLDLPREPIAVAISPRGEVVWLDFEGPDRWLLTRWRVGEDPLPAVPVAAVASAFAAQRFVGLAVDEGGRVEIAFVPDVPGDLRLVVVD